MSNNIAGEIVVITGASSELGKATAQLLSAEGASVVTEPDIAENIRKVCELAVPADSFARGSRIGHDTARRR